jgi:predicted TIM-barrel fold metal-dependent hydrolase
VYTGPLIDIDVHHSRESDHELLEYLPADWREFATSPGGGRLVPFFPGAVWADGPAGSARRRDTFPPTGGPPGSSYEFTKEQLLDTHEEYESVTLTHGVGQEAAMANPHFAYPLCEATNRWTAEKWLRRDPRLRSVISVPMHFPERTVAEIRRAAEDPQFVAVLLPFNAFGQPIGHPIYHPIYAVAAELGLPLYLHISTGEFFDHITPSISGGTGNNSRFDSFNTVWQSLPNHLTSLIGQGVFEKFPSLNVVVAECGLTWLPWFFASLESSYQLLRRESPWLRRHPAEYLHDHMVVSTQPWEATAQESPEFVADLALIDGIDDMLCYSSDYPHWDTDTVAFVSSVLPQEWHDKVFHDNALRAMPRTAGAGTRRDPVVAAA